MWKAMQNPVPARLRGGDIKRIWWLPAWLFRAKFVKGTAPSTTPDLEAIFQRVRQHLPLAKWQQVPVTLPADDDGIWFFWMPGAPGEVQIESSWGVCPFTVETDKHDDRLTTCTPEDTADAIVKWLRLPGGRAESPWHER
jgi:hypothetical protein